MAKTDFKCTCGKKYITFEKLAVHANKTDHLIETIEDKTYISWYEQLLFNFMDNAYTMEGALVVVLFLVVVLSCVLFYVVM